MIVFSYKEFHLINFVECKNQALCFLEKRITDRRPLGCGFLEKLWLVRGSVYCFAVLFAWCVGNAIFGAGPVVHYSTGPVLFLVLGQYWASTIFLVLGQYWASTIF